MNGKKGVKSKICFEIQLKIIKVNKNQREMLLPL